MTKLRFTLGIICHDTDDNKFLLYRRSNPYSMDDNCNSKKKSDRDKLDEFNFKAGLPFYDEYDFPRGTPSKRIKEYLNTFFKNKPIDLNTVYKIHKKEISLEMFSQIDKHLQKEMLEETGFSFRLRNIIYEDYIYYTLLDKIYLHMYFITKMVPEKITKVCEYESGLTTIEKCFELLENTNKVKAQIILMVYISWAVYNIFKR